MSVPSHCLTARQRNDSLLISRAVTNLADERVCEKKRPFPAHEEWRQWLPNPHCPLIKTLVITKESCYGPSIVFPSYSNIRTKKEVGMTPSLQFALHAEALHSKVQRMLQYPRWGKWQVALIIFLQRHGRITGFSSLKKSESGKSMQELGGA